MKSLATYRSLYNPIDACYIWAEARKTKPFWNEKTYTFFGYNGNYPELIKNALKNRGCWTNLDYNDACQLQMSKSAKHQKARAFGFNKGS